MWLCVRIYMMMLVVISWSRLRPAGWLAGRPESGQFIWGPFQELWLLDLGEQRLSLRELRFTSCDPVGRSRSLNVHSDSHFWSSETLQEHQLTDVFPLSESDVILSVFLCPASTAPIFYYWINLSSVWTFSIFFARNLHVFQLDPGI